MRSCGCSAGEAWRSEFWAPAAAEGALALVAGLARKCAWLGDAAARRQFAIAVPQARPVLPPNSPPLDSATRVARHGGQLLESGP